MDKGQEYYTLKGYQLMEEIKFTPAMEDYMEMIYRVTQKNGFIKIRDLSHYLNVRPSSSSKMAQHLNSLGYIRYERYGDITITEKGKAAGAYLLYRHNVVHSFLCMLNNSDNQLEETEKTEHFFSKRTIQNLDKLIKRLSSEKQE